MSGVPGSNFPGLRCTPGFPHSRRRSQSVWLLLTTVGVNLHPTLPLTARDGAENECTNRKAEILQQTILVHIDTFQNWISPENINPSDLDNNADSDLSTDIYCKISENHLQVTRVHLENLNHMNSDNNDTWPDTLFIDAIIMIAVICDSKKTSWFPHAMHIIGFTNGRYSCTKYLVICWLMNGKISRR